MLPCIFCRSSDAEPENGDLSRVSQRLLTFRAGVFSPLFVCLIHLFVSDVVPMDVLLLDKDLFRDRGLGGGSRVPAV